jgi:hypothetical protein
MPQADGVSEEGSENNAWNQEGCNKRKLMKTTRKGLHAVYFSSYSIIIIKSRKLRWAKARSMQIKDEKRIRTGKPEGRRPQGVLRRRRGDNIKIDIKEIVWRCVNWIHLVYGSDQWLVLVNTEMNFRVPQNTENFMSRRATISFSINTWLYEIRCLAG